jgi:citrate synthase
MTEFMRLEKDEDQAQENIHTRIWREEAEHEDPFLARACYCGGYDVYGELLYKASWAEYLYLLFKLEKPAAWQARLLECLAIALANPGPRDHSVNAAMTASVGGSTSASSLIAAISVGAGNCGGAREVYHSMRYWADCGCSLDAWRKLLEESVTEPDSDIWPEIEHPPGFEPYGTVCSTIVRQTLVCLTDICPGKTLAWLAANRVALEKSAKRPLAMTGVAAAALAELSFSPEEGEMLYLLFRLPGAAAHALEQYMQWRQYPFFRNGLVLKNDPGPKHE